MRALTAATFILSLLIAAALADRSAAGSGSLSSGVPSGPANPLRTLAQQPKLWTVPTDPAVARTAPYADLAAALPPYQYANGSGFTAVVVPSGKALVTTFIVKHGADGAVATPPSAVLWPDGGTATHFNMSRVLPGVTQRVTAVLAQSPLSSMVSTNWQFQRFTLVPSSNTYEFTQGLWMFGNRLEMLSQTRIPAAASSARKVAVVLHEVVTGVYSLGTFDYTYGAEDARRLGALPEAASGGVDPLQAADSCVAKACVLFAPVNGTLVAVGIPSGKKDNATNATLQLSAAFRSNGTDGAPGAPALVQATPLGGGMVAVARGSRVALARLTVTTTMAATSTTTVALTLVAERAFDGNVTALRFLSAGSLAVASDPAPAQAGNRSVAGRLETVMTADAASFSGGAAGSASPVQPGAAVVGLTVFSLDVDDTVVVAQQTPRAGVSVFYGTAVGYRGMAACGGGGADECLGAALWSNTEIVSGAAPPPVRFAQLPIDVAPARLTASDGNVVATTTWQAANVTAVTYTSVATGEVVMSVNYGGTGGAPAPLVVGRSGPSLPLVAVSPVVGADAPRALALASFDMTKAPEFGGADVPAGYSLVQTYVYPVTGATFSVYANATANSTVVRLSDGRKVPIDFIAMSYTSNVKVLSANTLCVWGSAYAPTSAGGAQSIVLIDRMSAEVRWSKLVPPSPGGFATSITVPDLASYALIFDGARANGGMIYDLRDANRVVGRAVDSVQWAAFVANNAYFAVMDQTATQLLVGTAVRAAIYNFVTNAISSNYSIHGVQSGINAARIVDDNGTFVTCESNQRMVKTRAGAIVGAPVTVNCYAPLVVTRGDVYTLSDVAAAFNGPYTYYVARPDFALGEAAMIELPGRNFSNALAVQVGARSAFLQATGTEQIAVVAITDETVDQQQQQQQQLRDGPAGSLVNPYVAGVDLVAGQALWVAPQDGTVGAWPYSVSYQGTPLQAKGAENLLFTSFRYPVSGQDALLAVDIFTGSVKWRLPLQSSFGSVALVGPLAAEPSPRVVLTMSSTTFTFERTSLAAAASPAGFRPADTPVFPVTGAPSTMAPVSTTAAPLPGRGSPGDGGLTTGAKAGIAIGCILVGLGLIGGAVFFVMQSRTRRQAQGGGAYTEVAEENNRGSRVLV